MAARGENHRCRLVTKVRQSEPLDTSSNWSRVETDRVSILFGVSSPCFPGRNPATLLINMKKQKAFLFYEDTSDLEDIVSAPITSFRPDGSEVLDLASSATWMDLKALHRYFPFVALGGSLSQASLRVFFPKLIGALGPIDWTEYEKVCIRMMQEFPIVTKDWSVTGDESLCHLRGPLEHFPFTMVGVLLLEVKALGLVIEILGRVPESVSEVESAISILLASPYEKLHELGEIPQGFSRGIFALARRTMHLRIYPYEVLLNSIVGYPSSWGLTEGMSRSEAERITVLRSVSYPMSQRFYDADVDPLLLKTRCRSIEDAVKYLRDWEIPCGAEALFPFPSEEMSFSGFKFGVDFVRVHTILRNFVDDLLPSEVGLLRVLKFSRVSSLNDLVDQNEQNARKDERSSPVALPEPESASSADGKLMVELDMITLSRMYSALDARENRHQSGLKLVGPVVDLPGRLGRDLRDFGLTFSVCRRLAERELLSPADMTFVHSIHHLRARGRKPRVFKASFGVKREEALQAMIRCYRRDLGLLLAVEEGDEDLRQRILKAD